MDLEPILDSFAAFFLKSNLTDAYAFNEDAIFESPANETDCEEGLCTGDTAARSHNGFHVQDDLSASASSGYGHCPEGIPVEFALLSILAAFGAAFGFLYRGLTLKTAGRRKREFGTFTFSSFMEETADYFWAGRLSMEEKTIGLYLEHCVNLI